MKKLLNLRSLKDEYLTIKSFYSMDYQDFNMPLHAHNYVEIMYAAKGKCTVTLSLNNELQEVTLKPQQFIVIDFDVHHNLRVDTPSSVMNIELKPTFSPIAGSLSFDAMKAASPSLTRFVQSFNKYAVFEDIANVSKIMRQIYAEELKTDKKDSPLVTQSLINILFVYIARCKDVPLFSNGNSHYNKVLKYIDKHVNDPISVQEIADYAGVSKAYLHRLFKERSNETLLQYINRLKIERAKKLIINTDLPLIDVAATLGYKNRQSFFLAFKKETGISPLAYKQSVQKQSFTIYHGIYQHEIDTKT